ncbi:DUF4003 family protein [Halobacillus sp. A5]|uniref:DUF4003 family protein n=1 Tax=Halobacillus sp. A5 TaxID=2880263 RepID=UPI0020A67E91|nr:DUF4003 family protein [Halobacillus sp. A5]MCP3025769.1 DUF4003 domain-containing protein [Halobacillus sp. A5]
MEEHQGEAIIEDFKRIFFEMDDAVKWTDKKVLMLAASVYAMNDSPFSASRYRGLCDFIKKEASLFSPLKSNLRFTAAAFLDARFTDTREKYSEFIEIYDKLVNKGFKKGNFTYITALVILADDRLKENEAQMERALKVFKEMKSEHPFITTNEDYPLAVLLSQLEGEAEEIVANVEYFYKQLSRNNFYKGNDLQFLSYILALDKSHDKDVLIDRVVQVYDQMKKISIKPKSVLYPEIGLLALMEQGKNELEMIQNIKDDLDRTKHFKWQKDINFKMAVNL